MKTRVTLLIGCGVVICWLLSLDITKPSARLVSQSARGWQLMVEYTDTLMILIDDDEIDWNLVEAGFINLRKSFKQTEMLVWYLSRDYTQRYINGAPLPYIEPNAPSLNILEPIGLQVIEEQISRRNAIQVRQLLKDMNRRMHDVQTELFQIKPTDRMVFEALKQEVIRISLLEVTGFENPVFTNAIEESAIAWNSLVPVVYEFALLVDDNNLRTKLETSLANGQALLKNTDFDVFDRLEFIREAAQPLYSALVEVQTELHIEFYEETGAIPKSVDERSKWLFSTELINPYYFTNLMEHEDSRELQELGRMLFFDPVLSANNKRACASCHNPKLAFTDGNPKSLAFDFNGTISRNAPTLINAVYAKEYFYDLRTSPLENQFEHVVFSDKEFNTSYTNIVSRVNQSEAYVDLFKGAFGKDARISKQTITTALAAYVASLISFNTPIDQYTRGEDVEVDDEVKEGFNLFMGKANCGTCHFAPTFAGLVPPFFEDTESEVLGMPKDSSNTEIDPDLGRAGGTLKQRAVIYEHSFKTTTVRNVLLTAPYMHNGAYQSLEQVIDFYNAGGGQGLGFEVPYQTLPSDSLGLSADEKKALIAFMHSLTDTTGLTGKPAKLPSFGDENMDKRTVGGEY